MQPNHRDSGIRDHRVHTVKVAQLLHQKRKQKPVGAGSAVIGPDAGQVLIGDIGSRLLFTRSWAPVPSDVFELHRRVWNAGTDQKGIGFLEDGALSYSDRAGYDSYRNHTPQSLQSGAANSFARVRCAREPVSCLATASSFSSKMKHPRNPGEGAGLGVIHVRDSERLTRREIVALVLVSIFSVALVAAASQFAMFGPSIRGWSYFYWLFHPSFQDPNNL